MNRWRHGWRRRTTWLLPVGFLALVLASPARAQESVPSEERPETGPQDPADGLGDPSRDAPAGVDEITVTGVRSDVTNVQNESQAITAFSMDDLDRSEIVNVDKLAFNVPALHIGQVGADSIITLRGIGTENATITGEPGLQFHVDGVNYGRPAGARVSFFDLEGLRVFRGPQGFEGGKNATAGTIHVITRKPHADFETTGDFQWGSYDQRRLRAAVNVPLNEYVQTRLALIQEDRDGYQENRIDRLRIGQGLFVTNSEDYNAFDADDLGFRASLRVLPLDRVENVFSYNYFEQGGVGPQTELQPLPLHQECDPVFFGRIIMTHHPNFAACALDLLARHRPATDEGSAVRVNSGFWNRPTSQDNKFWGWTNTINWELPTLGLLGETQVRNITSYQVIDLQNDGDRDATDLEAFRGRTNQETNTWYQELQWSGLGGELLDWQLSLLYMREHSESLADLFITLGFTSNVMIAQEVVNKSYGAALNTGWQVTDDLKLTLGGRYIKDVKRDKLLRDNASGFGDLLGTPLAVCSGKAEDILDGDGNIRADGIPDEGVPECKRTFRQVVGQLKVDWTPLERFDWWPTNDTLVYASLANGFKSGGFAAFEFGDYEPEYIWSFAGGLKNTLWDDRITANIESYYYHYRDLQQVVVDGISVRTENADAEIWGWEFEGSAEPLPGLRFDGNLAFTDTEFKRWDTFDPVDSRNSVNCRKKQTNPLFPGCIVTSFAGNELSRAPMWSYKIAVEYDIYRGQFGTLTPRVQYYWQDDTWYRGFNRTPQNSGPNCDVIESSFNPPADCGSIVNDLQPAYHTTDLKLRWTSPNETWNAEAFALNLENESIYQNVLVGSAALGNPGFAWFGPPRTYGFRVGFRY